MDDVMSVCSDHIGLYPGIQWEGGRGGGACSLGYV